MNKEEFLNYLSEKYKVEIIVDLPEPINGMGLWGQFESEPTPKIHLCETGGICIIFHEIGHWMHFYRFIDLYITHYKYRKYLFNLPLPDSCKVLLLHTLYSFFSFFRWLSQLNEEKRVSYFACETCGGRKFPIGKTIVE